MEKEQTQILINAIQSVVHSLPMVESCNGNFAIPFCYRAISQEAKFPANLNSFSLKLTSQASQATVITLLLTG